MKHIIGNSPMCYACKYFTEKIDDDIVRRGWCELGSFLNGKQISKKPHPTSWNNYCRNWIEVDTGLTHYEVLTGKVEESRTPIERMMFERLLHPKEGKG